MIENGTCVICGGRSGEYYSLEEVEGLTSRIEEADKIMLLIDIRSEKFDMDEADSAIRKWNGSDESGNIPRPGYISTGEDWND